MRTTAIPLVVLLALVATPLLIQAQKGGEAKAGAKQSAVAGGVKTPPPAPAFAAAGGRADCATDPLCGQPCSIIWYQLHGWLMWAGFGLLMPLGVIFSRHLQTVTKAWFHVHLACMMLGVACVVGGGVIGFINFGAIPATTLADPASLHVYFGLFVFSLACLNLLLGLGRPQKGSLPRVFWYALHFTCGTCTVACAWFVIFTGMDIYELNWTLEPRNSPYSGLRLEKILFAVQVSVVGFLYLFLGRWDYMVGQKDKELQLDGIKRRFTSTWHVASLAHLNEDVAAVEEVKSAEERAAAYA